MAKAAWIKADKQSVAKVFHNGSSRDESEYFHWFADHVSWSVNPQSAGVTKLQCDKSSILCAKLSVQSPQSHIFER